MDGIRVLIVDDSVFFREMISRELEKDLPAGTEIRKANDPFEARDLILEFDPDVMLLDVEMPRMNGIDFLRRLLSQYDLPTIVFSSRNVYKNGALEAGADAFILKPSATSSDHFIKELAECIIKTHNNHKNVLKNSANQQEENEAEELSPLRSMIRRSGGAASMGFGTRRLSASDASQVMSTMREIRARNSRQEALKAKTSSSETIAVATKPYLGKTIKLIAIGASTGGTEALAQVLRDLKPPLPPILIVQHIPPMFSRLFAERLDGECKISVKEAENGDKLQPNWAYVASGDKHMKLRVVGDLISAECFVGDKVNGHMPSVDVLFDSVAEKIGASALGVILTGMGEDGARGLVRMKDAGAVTLGQDEATCVVYGMPKAAYDMGGVTKQLPLGSIAGAIMNIAGKSN